MEENNNNKETFEPILNPDTLEVFSIDFNGLKIFSQSSVIASDKLKEIVMQTLKEAIELKVNNNPNYAT